MRNFSHECRQPRPPALEPHRRALHRAHRRRPRPRPSDGIATAKKGERADAPELSGETVDGGQVDVADYKGKVVVLNVWGSWCPPCRAEAKNFEKVYQDVKDQGVQFVGINTRDTSTGPARAFEKDYGVTYPSLYDPAGRLMLRFEKGTLNPQAVPSTLIIDREGKVAARTLQALSEEKLRKMLAPYLQPEK